MIPLSVNLDHHRGQDHDQDLNPDPDLDPEASLVAGHGPVQNPEADLIADHDLVQEGEGTSQDHIHHVEDPAHRQDIGHHVDVDTHPLQGDTHPLLQDHHAVEGKCMSYILSFYMLEFHSEQPWLSGNALDSDQHGPGFEAQRRPLLTSGRASGPKCLCQY